MLSTRLVMPALVRDLAAGVRPGTSGASGGCWPGGPGLALEHPSPLAHLQYQRNHEALEHPPLSPVQYQRNHEALELPMNPLLTFNTSETTRPLSTSGPCPPVAPAGPEVRVADKSTVLPDFDISTGN